MKTVNNHKGFKGKACKHRWQDVNYPLGSNLVPQKYYDTYSLQTIDLIVPKRGRAFTHNNYEFDEIKGNRLCPRNYILSAKTGYFEYNNLNRLTNETI